MAVYKIKIEGTHSGAVFDPASLAVDAGDQVSWTNTDSKEHWPGILNPDGSFVGFQENPIQKAGDEPFDVSSVWSVPARINDQGQQIDYTLTYVCGLHTSEKGTFVVSKTP